MQRPNNICKSLSAAQTLLCSTPRAEKKTHIRGPQECECEHCNLYRNIYMSAGGELIISSSALENDCDREPLLQMRNKSSPIGSIVICARSLARAHTRGHRKWAKPGPNKMWAHWNWWCVCMRDECFVCAEAEPPPRRLIVSMGRSKKIRARCNYTCACGKDSICSLERCGFLSHIVKQTHRRMQRVLLLFLARKTHLMLRERGTIKCYLRHELHAWVRVQIWPRQWAWSCRRMFVYIGVGSFSARIFPNTHWTQSI